MHPIRANFVDIPGCRIYPAVVEYNQNISGIRPLQNTETPADPALPYLLPGFVDAHIHIESSMLVPSEFARLAVVHGTVATVSDPHEIANVCGSEGISFMLHNGNSVPFKFNFGAPSCVPATVFETAGAVLDCIAVEQLLDNPEIRYLSEMMNFPGALQADPEVIKKINAALSRGKPVDGHAPGLRGEDARTYISRGISTDHECFTLEEAQEKLQYGMKIIIREGSAARNFEALYPLLHQHADMMMFGSDDKHPDELVLSHINALCARAVAAGVDLFNVLQAACINPVLHYGLPVGLLRDGDPADFILVEDLRQFRVLKTWINGTMVAENGKSLIQSIPVSNAPNKFSCNRVDPAHLSLLAPNGIAYPKPVIEALDGQLITLKSNFKPLVQDECYVPDLTNDVLKLVVINRYHPAPPAIAFIRNFGLKQGAIASSVAHDSHNIIAVGADDEALAKAINLIIGHQGGVSISAHNIDMVLPLPVAGLMSADDGYRIAELYSIIDRAAKEAGSTLRSPFMTLSFMGLLVIPHVKLSDQGLFDGDAFSVIM